MVNILPLEPNESPPFELLELADPSRKHIQAYLETGHCFVAKVEEEIIGVLVLDQVDRTTLEIKNIAVEPFAQRQGIGKALLNYAEQVGRRMGYPKLMIGTGNSSLQQLALYQRVGFEMEAIEKNFFLEHYDQPIVENGIFCKHKIILLKILME